MQNDIEEGTVYFQFPVVVNETEFPESVHKETDTRARCTHHLRKSLLTDLGNDLFGPPVLAETR